jgi:hypothetical protein
LFIATPTGPVPSSLATPPVQKARAAENYGKIPLTFEANEGQADKSAKFLARGSGYGVYLTGHEAALKLCKPVYDTSRADFLRNATPVGKSAVCDVVHMQLAGANSTVEPIGEERLQGTVNYFIGSDPTKWHAGIPTYAKVRYTSIYPGIDLFFHGIPSIDGQLEFDFVVAPHAAPRAIRLQFSGAKHLHLAANGDLLVATANGTLAFRKPLAYQLVGGQRHPIAGNFALVGRHPVRFQVGRYDHTKPLVIDPVLAFSTFLGGSAAGGTGNVSNYDKANAIAVDSAGNVYVAGQTFSTDFPVTPGAFQTTNHTAVAQNGDGVTAFVTKLNPTGSELIYSTYMGGSGGDVGNAIAVDTTGNVYVAGMTESTDFPVTPGAFQTTNHAAANNNSNTFVSKLNPAGSALVYSTYLGGSGLSNEIVAFTDKGNAIAVDAAGNAYVTGATFSTDFPVTSGAFQTTNHAAVGYSNAFVTKLNPAGTALVYSTFLGGSTMPLLDLSSGDIGNAIAVDAAGDAYVAGQTGTTDFPVTPGAFQTTNQAAPSGFSNAFITMLNPAGTALVYSTFLGGSGGKSTGESANAIAADAAGNVYVAGQTGSTDFPVTSGAFQTTNHTLIGYPNAFVTKLNPTGSELVYSTYLGGSGNRVFSTPTLWIINGGDQASGMVIDSSGNVYVAGSTSSSDFPVTQDAYQATNNDQCASGCVGGYNAFIAELNSTGSGLVYSTYLGGNGINPKSPVEPIVYGRGDWANALALDNSGNVYVAGSASSADFPITGGAFLTTIPSGGSGFVAKLNMAAAGSGGFTITGTAVTLTAGATTGNTSTITVTPYGGFTGSVALTAAVTSSPSGIGEPPTLSFGSTSPVNISGTGAGTATLTIATTAPNNCGNAAYETPRGVFWYTGGGAAPAFVLLFGVPARRRRWRLALVMLALLVTLMCGWLACGGGGSSVRNCGPINPGTPAGTYTITVTGTSGAITATGPVTLTVQ